MYPLAPACRRPEVVRLAAQNVRNEFAVAVDRRSFPQEQALDRQQRMTGIIMPARRIREAIAGARHGVDDGAVEVTAWIGEVSDLFAESSLEFGLRCLDLLGNALRRLDRQRYVAACVRADDEAATPHVVHHVPGDGERHAVKTVADTQLETPHETADVRLRKLRQKRRYRKHRI